MDSVIQAFITAFNMITDIKLFEIPVLVWLILPSIIALILKFINGKK